MINQPVLFSFAAILITCNYIRDEHVNIIEPYNLETFNFVQARAPARLTTIRFNKNAENLSTSDKFYMYLFRQFAQRKG